MIFYFEKGIDLGDYKRCRFFYSLTNEGEIPLPTTGENYNGVRMAFKALVIATNCWIKQTNRYNKYNYRINKALHFFSFTTLSRLLYHKTRLKRHLILIIILIITNILVYKEGLP